MNWVFSIIFISISLTGSRSQLSFQPPNPFYDLEQGTGQNVSCLYAGGVSARIRWLEGSSLISATHLLSLSTQSLGHHTFSCEYAVDGGGVETKQLTVNIFRSTQLQFLPTPLNYSLSTQLTNSTPFYVYCLGYGHPLPHLEWRDENVAIASLPSDDFDAEFNTSLAVIDLKRFSPGRHPLSCYGFNGFSSDQIYLELFVDSTNPLIITPSSTTSLNNTLLYSIDQNSTLTLHCSVRTFSFPSEQKWLGTTPYWTTTSPSIILSNTSSLSLSNRTLGHLACVLHSSLDNTTVTRPIQVSFVRPSTPTPSTSSTTTSTTVSYVTTNTSVTTQILTTTRTNTTYDTSSTTPHIATTTTVHTTPRSDIITDTLDQTDTTMSTTTSTVEYLSLSPLLITIIISTLFTLLCLSLMGLLSICCIIACRYVIIRRHTRRKRRRLSRIQYIDVMEDTYPSPPSVLSSLSNTQRDSNEYSQMSSTEFARNHSTRGISQTLGVRVPIYERIPDDLQVSINSDENAVVLTSEQPHTSPDNSINTSETSA